MDAAKVIQFLHLVERLKRTKRTGWVDNAVQQPESIADHMYRMGIISMLVPDSSLDRSKCVKISIVHDLAESIVGDITPHAGVSKEEKKRLEEDAMREIINMLGGGPIAEEIYSLWREYEDGTTPEGRLVKDIDKFEMIVQAVEYEKSDKKVLQSFFDSTKGKFQHPTIKEWVEQLYVDRASNCSSSSDA